MKHQYELDLKVNDSSLTGIKQRCVFNEIDNFHIYENYSIDVMHDFWEGVAKYTINNVLNALIKSNDNKLTLEIMNSRIITFKYNEVENSNKPRPLYYKKSK